MHVLFIMRLLYLRSCMLSNLCSYSSQVVVLDLKRDYMLDRNVHASFIHGLQLTKTTKGKDVLLLLRVKQRCLFLRIIYIAYIMYDI